MSGNSFLHSCLITTPMCNLILIFSYLLIFFKLDAIQFLYIVIAFRFKQMSATFVALFFPLKCKTLCLLLHINGFSDATTTNQFSMHFFQIYYLQSVCMPKCCSESPESTKTV